MTEHHPNLTFYICDGLWASVSVSPPFLGALLVIALGLLIWRLIQGGVFTRYWEIDEAEIGIGDQKIKDRAGD